jgi:hypothetical protein
MRSRKRRAEVSGGPGEPVHEIVARCLDRLNRGETIDPLEIVTEDPESAGEVLERLNVFLALGALVERETGPSERRHR